MNITYKVERSLTGLTQSELNTLGQNDWDLQVIIEENIGYQYIFVETEDPITYAVAFAPTGLTPTELQEYGDEDWDLIATVTPDKSIGTYYYFRKDSVGPPS